MIKVGEWNCFVRFLRELRRRRERIREGGENMSVWYINCNRYLVILELGSTP